MSEAIKKKYKDWFRNIEKMGKKSLSELKYYLQSDTLTQNGVNEEDFKVNIQDVFKICIFINQLPDDVEVMSEIRKTAIKSFEEQLIGLVDILTGSYKPTMKLSAP